ncbi:MAG: hypothetical protein HC855_08805 [Rhizobiales bacterium]|nr:hypothetical protein [Hyphomicrobiales bacterium]
MSQTETIMLFVLGFAFAGLVALFLGRLAWQIALRLGARRMQRQVPTTVAELQAERDRLRAEYAMMSRNSSFASTMSKCAWPSNSPKFRATATASKP